MYADTDADFIGVNIGSFVGLNVGSACDLEPPPELGAVDCAEGIVCNAIHGNAAEDVNGQPTQGVAILMQTYSDILAYDVDARYNQGSELVRLIDGYGSNVSTLSNCLLANNDLSGNLLRVDGDRLLDIDGTTIANNLIGAAAVLSLNGDVSFGFSHSILWQPGKASLAQSGGSRTVQHVITSERMSLDGGNTPYVLERNPRFEDAEMGDYHLIAASPAVDGAPAVGGTDLEGAPRATDIPVVPNWMGPTDIGAFERQGTFSMVRNRGFGPDFRLWNELTPGVASWEAQGADSEY